MTERRHTYQVGIRWSGRTTGYDGYSRDHAIAAPGRPDIAGSSDPAFRGSPDRWNPEQLLVASLSACHKLWFLHLAAEAGLVVSSYTDEAEGVMVEENGVGEFESVTLHPRVVLAEGDADRLPALHREAHRHCFIARSVRFNVQIDH